LGVELGPKQLQLLHELVPAATIMAVLVNPDFPVAESQAQELHAAARKLGLEFHILHASSERDLDMIFVKMVEMRVGALAITADPFFLSRREQILTLATRHSLPAMSPWREAAAAGGLVSYGTSASDGYRQVGQYAGRILKGEKPADLPVQQATKFALFPADNFCISPRALPRCRPSHGSRGRKPIRRGPCASSLAIPPAALPTLSRA
jgi:putative tryptophan/tyrosine transport system substrate-binding protein